MAEKLGVGVFTVQQYYGGIWSVPLPIELLLEALVTIDDYRYAKIRAYDRGYVDGRTNSYDKGFSKGFDRGFDFGLDECE
jgi:hypothetical protein